MKRILFSARTFFSVLVGCISEAWQDSERHYHIPKSRFCDGVPRAHGDGGPHREAKASPRNAFVGSFRDCFVRAWEAADTQYHIPKSRYQDAEYNRTAYRSSTDPGFWSKVRTFLSTLKSCISASWEASDTFYHLPRSRYQDAEFIRKLMKLSPAPRGELLYRPYTIGLGVVVSDSTRGGWTIDPGAEELQEAFVITGEVSETRSEPELEM